jgi:hypothetical protein
MLHSLRLAALIEFLDVNRHRLDAGGTGTFLPLETSDAIARRTTR